MSQERENAEYQRGLRDATNALCGGSTALGEKVLFFTYCIWCGAIRPVVFRMGKNMCASCNAVYQEKP